MSAYRVERRITGGSVLCTLGTLAECLAYLKSVPKKHRCEHIILDPNGKPMEGVTK